MSKNCARCGKIITSKYGIKYCSKSCSAIVNNRVPKIKARVDSIFNYSKKCFSIHKRECVICGENLIVEVHHMDENRRNDAPINLVPLCPTHHKYWHSKHRYIIEDKVHMYLRGISDLVIASAFEAEETGA